MGDILFYAPCNDEKIYYNQTTLGNCDVNRLGDEYLPAITTGGVNDKYWDFANNSSSLKIAYLLQFTNNMPGVITVEWWQKDISAFGVPLMLSAGVDSKKLQIHVYPTDTAFENKNFSTPPGQLDYTETSAWRHIAYVQDLTNSVTYGFVDGVYTGFTNTKINEYVWNTLSIGCKSYNISTTGDRFYGSLDEIVITSGAKYPSGSDFTPSTSAQSLTGLVQIELASSANYVSKFNIGGSNILIKADQVINQNSTSFGTKQWIGTKAQFDLIINKDANTKYIITDDEDGNYGLSIDTALSTTSTNPVENRVITNAIQNMAVATNRFTGEIVESPIPLTEAGLHELDGSVLVGTGSYADFVTYMAGKYVSNPELFCTESYWQQSITNYGVCGKFVYDSNGNSVRLPLVSNTNRYLIDSSVDGTSWYNLYSDGWCEQGGETPIFSGTDSNVTVNLLKNFINTNYLVIVNGSQSYHCSYGTLDSNLTSSFKARREANSGIADEAGRWFACGYVDVTSLRTNPLYKYIVVANTTNTQVEVDINEVMNDLATKVDKADLDEVQCVVETYSSGSSWYRVYSDGWCEQGGIDSFSSVGTRTATINLLKQFKDENYSIFLDCFGSQGAPGIRISAQSVDSFAYAQQSAESNYVGTKIFWEAKGYI